MKHSVIRQSMIILLVGLVAAAADRAYAQDSHRNEIIIESLSWGIAPGKTARVSVVNFVFLDGSVRSVRGRIQLLDTEGAVVAQSDEIRVEPGQTRFWDAAYEQIGGDPEPPTGRLQLRARIVFEKRSFDPNRPPVVGLEILDSSTGVTSNSYRLYNPYVTVDYLEQSR
jgi:prepilin-type processing-associated H-X9-DG protein